MRLIDADALLATFNKKSDIAEALLDKDVSADFLVYCKVADAVESLPTVDAKPVRQWISVKDKLPEKNTEVLVKFRNNMAVGFVNKSNEWAINSGGGWHTTILSCDEFPVYWMPLPSPPKEDD